MFEPISAARFVGLEHYRYLLFEDPLFWLTLKNTFVYAGATTALSTVGGLVMAAVLQKVRWRALWRTLFFLPMVTNVVAVAHMWQIIYNPRYGILNEILARVGLPRYEWLHSPNQAMWAVILVGAWAGLGAAILLFTAGLETLPDVYFDAARVDGANSWQILRFIAIPLLRPITLFVTLISLIQGLQSFALIFVMTGGGPLNATRVLSLYMYETAFTRLRMGRASAMAFLLFCVIFGLSLIQLRLFRDSSVEEA